MYQAKRPSKKKYPAKAISVLGIAGMSFAASSEGSVANIAPSSTVPSNLIAFGDEEIADVSLATFHVFDNEAFAAQAKSPVVQVAWRGCGCGHGCRGCGGWHRGCGGCGGCGWRPWCASRGGCHFC